MKSKTSNILNAVLSVFIVITVIVAFASTIITVRYTDADAYLDKILVDEYDDVVAAGVRDLFSSQTSVVSFSADEMLKKINTDDIIALSKRYTTDFINALVGGTEFDRESEAYNFRSDGLRKYIETKLREEIEAQHGTFDESSEADVESIYQIYESGINYSIRYIPVRLVTMVNEQISPMVKTVKSVSRIAMAISIILLALEVVMSLLINARRSVMRKTYRLAAPFFVAMALISGPYTVMYANNTLEKLRALNSALACLESGIYSNIITVPFFVVISITIVLLAVTVYTRAMLFFRKQKGYESLDDEPEENELNEEKEENT